MAEPEALTATHSPGRTAAARPPAQDWLDTPLADGASVVAFQVAAIFGSEVVLALVSPTARLLVGAGLGALGPLGCGIERGEARRMSWAAALAGAALAALAQGSLLLGITALDVPGDWGAAPGMLAARGALILVLGTLLARFGSRFDRGETGWREACRHGPALGGSPLADRIASFRLPRPLAWSLLLALPVTLALRGLCLLLILGYQLTASRLMPPACRYEPSCSRYGFGAYLRHGCVRGSLLTALRLIRCSPIGPGGYDPVPTPDRDPG